MYGCENFAGSQSKYVCFMWKHLNKNLELFKAENLTEAQNYEFLFHHFTRKALYKKSASKFKALFVVNNCLENTNNNVLTIKINHIYEFYALYPQNAHT